MPRRKKGNLVRDIGIDLRFQSQIMQKFINIVMKCGKKNTARRIVYEAMDILAQKAGGDQKAFEMFERAVTQIRPSVEVKSRRVGGGVYQIPIEVRANRAAALSFRWLLDAARKRSDKTMGKRIAYELLAALEGQGNAFKKKADTHRMAEANRAFSHYAW